VMIAWKYHNNLSMRLYRPALVFRDFAFLQLLDPTDECLCRKSKRLARYLDVRTSEETSSVADTQVHVRIVDTNIIHHKGLKQAVAMGLNHIPLKPTSKLDVSIAVAIDGFSQLSQILSLEKAGLNLDLANEWIRATCLEQLKVASKTNKYGFRVSGKDLLREECVTEEIKWLTTHLYCSGLDKASNNACFVCIRHIRLLALERLSGPDFIPCKDELVWLLPSTVLDQISKEILILVPELQISFRALPYLMSTYKQHKNRYRWLTNAFQTCYSNLAHLLTIATMALLESVKEWAVLTYEGYTRFLRCNTSIYWLVNSSIEVALNLPAKIHDVFVADITRCYESIPLQGNDNLLDAIAFIIRLGYKQAKVHHPRAEPMIWIRVGSDGTATKATWSTSCPSYGNCFSISAGRLIELHRWLMMNCHVNLGDRVWKQTLGIPMGFSCSPLWCNTYLLCYEIRFMQRLAKLNRTDLMSKFQSAFRYIDDLCWINTQNPMEFLSPTQNPFWVYPLDVLEIKCEVSKYDELLLTRGIQARFMNLELTVIEPDVGKVAMCKYDKRRTLPFKYTQYIMFASNRPIKQSYSIAVSQTVPILYLSSSHQAAAKEVNILINTLVRNGFREKRLRHVISEFLINNPFPGLRFDLELLSASVRYDIPRL
jgi:uncharacterized protein YuzB (UPF0349 family)